MAPARKANRIVVILASPRRNGNSALLAKELAKGAGEAGAEVESFYIQGMDISPCNGCDSCQVDPGSGCTIPDDMQRIYDSLASAVAVVFASPVYWFSVTAQAKTVIDRLYAVGGGEANRIGHLVFALILTYADADPFHAGAANAVRMFQDITSYLGTEIEGIVHGTAHAPGEIRKNRELLEQARELGRSLARRKARAAGGMGA